MPQRVPDVKTRPVLGSPAGERMPVRDHFVQQWRRLVAGVCRREGWCRRRESNPRRLKTLTGW